MLMNRKFRLLFGFFMFAVIIIGLLSSIRLFSWDTLIGAHKFFYVSWTLLAGFGLIVLLLFSRLDDVVVVSTKNLDDVPEVKSVVKSVVPIKKVDPELEELRKEAEKVPPFVPPDTSLTRNPEPVRVTPPIVTRLTNDFSMYDEKRNILKPVPQQENKSEYDGVF